MNKHTPQEWADWTGCYVNQDKNGLWYLHKHKPELMLEEGYWNPQKGANDFEMNIFSILISAPADHNWTHLYEPRLSGTDTHEERMENARITHDTPHPENKPDHASEVYIHKEYVVAEGSRTQDLSKKVNTLLSHGWKLQGGVAIEHFPESDGYKEGSAVFYQAMVRGL